MASHIYVKDLTKQHTFQEPKLAQLNKALHDWFTARHFEGKTMTGPMMIDSKQKKTESVCDAPEPAAKRDTHMEYSSH